MEIWTRQSRMIDFVPTCNTMFASTAKLAKRCQSAGGNPQRGRAEVLKFCPLCPIASRWLTSLGHKPRCTPHTCYHVKTWRHPQNQKYTMYCTVSDKDWAAATATCTENFLKFWRGFEICKWTDRHASWRLQKLISPLCIKQPRLTFFPITLFIIPLCFITVFHFIVNLYLHFSCLDFYSFRRLYCIVWICSCIFFVTARHAKIAFATVNVV